MTVSLFRTRERIFRTVLTLQVHKLFRYCMNRGEFSQVQIFAIWLESPQNKCWWDIIFNDRTPRALHVKSGSVLMFGYITALPLPPPKCCTSRCMQAIKFRLPIRNINPGCTVHTATLTSGSPWILWGRALPLGPELWEVAPPPHSVSPGRAAPGPQGS